MGPGEYCHIGPLVTSAAGEALERVIQQYVRGVQRGLVEFGVTSRDIHGIFRLAVEICEGRI